MTTLEKIERLQGLQQSLEGCTRPCKGHTDPLSINDCWNWMRELLEELKDTEQSRIAAVSGSLPLAQNQLDDLKTVANLFTYTSQFDEPLVSEEGIKQVIEKYEEIRRQ